MIFSKYNIDYTVTLLKLYFYEQEIAPIFQCRVTNQSLKISNFENFLFTFSYHFTCLNCEQWI